MFESESDSEPESKRGFTKVQSPMCVSQSESDSESKGEFTKLTASQTPMSVSQSESDSESKGEFTKLTAPQIPMQCDSESESKRGFTKGTAPQSPMSVSHSGSESELKGKFTEWTAPQIPMQCDSESESKRGLFTTGTAAQTPMCISQSDSESESRRGFSKGTAPQTPMSESQSENESESKREFTKLTAPPTPMSESDSESKGEFTKFTTPPTPMSESQSDSESESKRGCTEGNAPQTPMAESHSSSGSVSIWESTKGTSPQTPMSESQSGSGSVSGWWVIKGTAPQTPMSESQSSSGSVSKWRFTKETAPQTPMSESQSGSGSVPKWGLTKRTMSRSQSDSGSVSKWYTKKKAPQTPMCDSDSETDSESESKWGFTKRTMSRSQSESGSVSKWYTKKKAPQTPRYESESETDEEPISKSRCTKKSKPHTIVSGSKPRFRRKSTKIGIVPMTPMSESQSETESDSECGVSKKGCTKGTSPHNPMSACGSRCELGGTGPHTPPDTPMSPCGSQCELDMTGPHTPPESLIGSSDSEYAELRRINNKYYEYLHQNLNNLTGKGLNSLYQCQAISVQPITYRQQMHGFKNYHFQVEIPFANCILNWDMIFDPEDFGKLPEFIFNDEFDTDFIPSYLPSCDMWDLSYPYAIRNILNQCFNLYKERQLQKLRKFARVNQEYEDLMNKFRLSPDKIEVYIKTVVENREVYNLINFLVNIPVDFTKLPESYQDGNEKLVNSDKYVYFHTEIKMKDDKMKTKTFSVVLSPRVKQALRTNEPLPAFAGKDPLTTCTQVVKHFIETQIELQTNQSVMYHNDRRSFVIQIIVNFPSSITSCDQIKFYQVTFKYENADLGSFSSSVTVKLNNKFPQESPKITINSLNCQMALMGKNCKVSVPFEGYEPQGSRAENINALKKVLQKYVGLFKHFKH